MPMHSDNGRQAHPRWCDAADRCRAASGGMHRSREQSLKALDGLTSATVWLEQSATWAPPQVTMRQCGPGGELRTTWDLVAADALGMLVAALAAEGGLATATRPAQVDWTPRDYWTVGR